MKHYIYRVEEKTTGEFYWGVRSCKCEIIDDTYMGSMKSWKPDKQNLVKTYTKQFSTRELAYEAEYIVIKYFGNKEMFPLNRNHTNRFGAQENRKLSPEHKEKLAVAMRLRKFSDEHKKNIAKSCTNRSFTEEHRKNISLAARNRTRKPE